MRTARRLEEMSRQLDMVYTALLVRDPGTSMSAEAYEGLRKQVVAAFSARRAHVSQLAHLDQALATTSDIDALRGLSVEWLGAAGVEKVEDVTPDTISAFEVLGDGDGPLVVDAPAYLDTATGQPARLGRAHRGPSPEPGLPSSATSENEED